MNIELKAPFPWFGGKSKVADLVWSRFGCTGNFVEPFAGSLAVLLGRPHDAATETVNDKDAFLSNFWRAIQFDPETTARWADWPVSEPDLEARHRWLINTGAARLELVKADPHFYDAQVAGWWVWGLCSWIGSGWCVQRRNGSASPGKQSAVTAPNQMGGAARTQPVNAFGFLPPASVKTRNFFSYEQTPGISILRG